MMNVFLKISHSEVWICAKEGPSEMNARMRVFKGRESCIGILLDLTPFHADDVKPDTVNQAFKLC